MQTCNVLCRVSRVNHYNVLKEHLENLTSLYPYITKKSNCGTCTVTTYFHPSEIWIFNFTLTESGNNTLRKATLIISVDAANDDITPLIYLAGKIKKFMKNVAQY